VYRIFAALVASVIWSCGAAAQACEPLGWKEYLSAGEQDYEVVEKVPLSGEEYILAVRFGELKGEVAKLYLFIEAEGECYKRAFSVGSYEATNSIYTGPGRLYHLDLYEPDAHSTLGFDDTAPTFEAMREKAIELFRD